MRDVARSRAQEWEEQKGPVHHDGHPATGLSLLSRPPCDLRRAFPALGEADPAHETTRAARLEISQQSLHTSSNTRRHTCRRTHTCRLAIGEVALPEQVACP